MFMTAPAAGPAMRIASLGAGDRKYLLQLPEVRGCDGRSCGESVSLQARFARGFRQARGHARCAKVLPSSRARQLRSGMRCPEISFLRRAKENKPTEYR